MYIYEECNRKISIVLSNKKHEAHELISLVGSLLTVLAAWSSAPDHFGSLISRCQRLQPEQRHLLCGGLRKILNRARFQYRQYQFNQEKCQMCSGSQLCLALCDPVGALEDSAEALRARAALASILDNRGISTDLSNEARKTGHVRLIHHRSMFWQQLLLLLLLLLDLFSCTF